MLLNAAGERVVQDSRVVLRYERMHRYAMCGDIVSGKDVLDVGSGAGYGSAMLARTARTVVAVEPAPDAVQAARRHFYSPNLRFMVAAYTALPVADAAVDVVVCFDAIERAERPDEVMAEIRRVLKPDGLLVISSPNQNSDRGDSLRDDVGGRALYFDDFANLLQRYFPNVSYHGQRLAAASFVYTLVPHGDASAGIVTSCGD